jgi:hypothetical protein
VIWCFFHIAYYFIDGGDAVFEYTHYTVHVNLGGCLCKKNNQTLMTGQDREISDTLGKDFNRSLTRQASSEND